MDELNSQKLTILINGQPQIVYHRAQPLAAQQLGYLDSMDGKMDAGIELDGEWIKAPDTLKRAQFVAVHLFEAMQQDNDPLIAASSAWLADRLPELKQVVATLVDGGLSVELVFDQHYSEEVSVSFIPRLSS